MKSLIMRITTFLLGFFLSLSINAQTTCTVENLFVASYDIAVSAHLGQSFVACQTGTLKSIAVLVAFGQTTTGATINFYDGPSTAPANLLGSVTGQTLTDNGGSGTGYDVTDFSGLGISVTSGNTYTFDIPTTAYLVISTNDADPTGNLFLNGNNLIDNNDLIYVITIESASNTAPTAVANTGSSLSEGGTDIVSSSELEFDDAEEPDTDITYTLDDLPDNGTLRKNTVALTLGGTFTQDDINNNRIDYVHNGRETTSDSFRVDVSDGQGGTVDDQTFNFTIAPVDDAPIAGSGTALDFDGANEFVELNSTTFGNFGTNPFTTTAAIIMAEH